MRTKGLWLIPLLALFFLVQLPMPVAHASGPHQVQATVKVNCTISSSPGTCVLLYPIGVTAGNVLIALYSYYGPSTLSVTFATTDTEGSSFTDVAKNCQATADKLCSGIGYASAKSTATDTITVTETGSTAGTILLAIEEWNGVPGPLADVHNTGFCTSSCGSTPQNLATASTAFSGSPFVAVGMYQVDAGIIGGGLFWTSVAPFGNFAVGGFCIPDTSYCADNSTSAPSPVTFPTHIAWGSGTLEWVGSGAVIYTASPNVTVVVVPCTFFQLQCWWYPMFFMLSFSGLFLFVAGVSRTPPKQAMHLFLSGLTFGSIVAVIFGILTIAVPLVLLILNTLYVVRFRGR